MNEIKKTFVCGVFKYNFLTVMSVNVISQLSANITVLKCTSVEIKWWNSFVPKNLVRNSFDDFHIYCAKQSHFDTCIETSYFGNSFQNVNIGMHVLNAKLMVIISLTTYTSLYVSMDLDAKKVHYNTQFIFKIFAPNVLSNSYLLRKTMAFQN